MKTAKYIEDIVDGYGVNCAEEGIFLRNMGIKKTIKVLGFAEEEWQKASAFNLLPVIGNIDILKAVLKKTKRLITDIKIDSGMNRIGLKTEEDMFKLKQLINQNKDLKVNCFHTHFAFTDFENMSIQALKFEKLCAIVDKDIKKSACASGGLNYGKRFLYAEVRAGISIYGYMPSPNTFLPLSAALSVTAPILDIKTMNKGDKIGYSGLYKANKGDKIGIIRGGYFDGINRDAKGWKVFVNGNETCIVGSVCMDFCFVILNGIKAKLGDKVLLLSPKNDAEKFAKHCGTIPYEILTQFKGRTQRIYYI